MRVKKPDDAVETGRRPEEEARFGARSQPGGKRPEDDRSAKDAPGKRADPADVIELPDRSGEVLVR